jgi:DNA invertase Pin-like site-specific DNA recombinase
MKVHRIAPKSQFQKKRVAAYARVSTLTEEQNESFETQMNYYWNIITQSPDWEFAGIYSDHGITGLSAEKRSGFMNMIQAARDGKMDLILVKSISRFARNAVEAQKYIQMLKQCNVEVRFEWENISSFDRTAEMTFHMLSAVAQEESRAISQRVKWSNQKRAEQGVRKLGNGRVFGYDEIDGKLVPNQFAGVIREIFKMYAEGLSFERIATDINKKHDMNLVNMARVQYILQNEIYIGDRLIQKKAPKNYLTKKPDDTQAYDSYYITGNHKAIISRSLWGKVQERRNSVGKRSDSHFMYGKIYCSQCGALMQRKSVKVKGEMTKVWKCSERIKGKNGNGCKNRIVQETELFEEIKRQMNWKCFFEKAFTQKVERVEVGEKISLKLR